MIGFYAATNTATQVTTNDENVAHAFVASESGMDFMRYQLANVHIPATTPPDQVIDKLYTELQSRLNTTGNMGSYTVGRNGNTITIPGDSSGRIKLDSNGNSGFRITITDWLGEIVCKSQGITASRSVPPNCARRRARASGSSATSRTRSERRSRSSCSPSPTSRPAPASARRARAGRGSASVSDSARKLVRLVDELLLLAAGQEDKLTHEPGADRSRGAPAQPVRGVAAGGRSCRASSSRPRCPTS